MVPRHGAFSWQTFPHERFDLSRTVSFPAVSPGVDDAFYEVQIAPHGLGRSGVHVARRRPPDRADLVRDRADQGSVGDGGPIRFRTVEPPAAGSADVYLLARPDPGGTP